MKKLIFLLVLAVAFAGMVSAQDTAHPPGVMYLEAALSGYGVDNYAVTPDTVLAISQRMAPQASILAIPDYNLDTAGQPQRYNLTKPIETEREAAACLEPDYWLRL